MAAFDLERGAFMRPCTQHRAERSERRTMVNVACALSARAMAIAQAPRLRKAGTKLDAIDDQARIGTAGHVQRFAAIEQVRLDQQRFDHDQTSERFADDSRPFADAVARRHLQHQLGANALAEFVQAADARRHSRPYLTELFFRD
jgi:hypothetical protein